MSTAPKVSRYLRRRRSVSNRVTLSLLAVVMFQGIISIVVVGFMMSEIGNSEVSALLDRTGRIIEELFNREVQSVVDRVRILSQNANLQAGLRSGELDSFVRDLYQGRLSSNFDAVVVADANFSIKLTHGNREAVAGAVDEQIFLAYNVNPLPLVPNGVSIMYQWAIQPIRDDDGRLLGLIAGAIKLDRWFVNDIEKLTNTAIILSYRSPVMINGSLYDADFIEYVRRSTEQPIYADDGQLKNWHYRKHRFVQQKEVTVVYFVHSDATDVLRHSYLPFAITFLIIVLVIALSLGVVLYQGTFRRPFIHFMGAIKALAAGRLDYSPTSYADTEFGELEKEFHSMVRSLKIMEQKLTLATRMAAVGEMVAAVAHQLRNPLGIMKVSVGMLAGYVDSSGSSRTADGGTGRADGTVNGNRNGTAHGAGTARGLNGGSRADGTISASNAAKAQELVDVLSKEIDSLSALVESYLDVCRPMVPRVSELPVSLALNEALIIVPRDQFPGVSIVKELADLPPVRIDHSFFTQIASNLVYNALQASKPGTEVRVKVEAGPADSLGRETIVLTVSDEGCGMAPDVVSQLFNPFFTTKPRGTGLGLSIVHRMVESHGGSIRVRSVPGKGSIFAVTIPQLPEPAKEPVVVS